MFNIKIDSITFAHHESLENKDLLKIKTKGFIISNILAVKQVHLSSKLGVLHPLRTVDIPSMSWCHKNGMRRTGGKQGYKNCEVVYYSVTLQ